MQQHGDGGGGGSLSLDGSEAAGCGVVVDRVLESPVGSQTWQAAQDGADEKSNRKAGLN